ncbi:MAG: NAD-dependent epimerase/dehydratase family protein [Paracoccaceae bacterium]
MGGLTLVITGAGGFLGRHAVAEARARGHAVQAVLRGDPPEGWGAGVQPVTADLADPTATATLTRALRGADAVIHAAAALTGDDATHARDTLGTTKTLLAAMAALGADAPRLVLVGSLAVYDHRALPEGGTLDETASLEPRPWRRDAYCRAKLAQEALCQEAARAQGFDLTILRPGAIYGPGRAWNAHLGPGFGPVLLRLSGKGEVPLSHVTHAAEAAVRAAEAPTEGVTVINVVDDALPDRAAFIAAFRKSGWPGLVLPLPWKLLRMVSPLAPAFAPGLLRAEVLAARAKPLRYANARLHALGWKPRIGFEEALAQALGDGA